MRQKTLLLIGGYAVLTALYIGLAPGHWYANVPGVSDTGPLNMHFSTDVALAFLSSGAALIWAGVRRERSVAFCGAAWLCLHALYHIWIWIARGALADQVAVTNLVGIQLPALLAIWAAIVMKKGETP